VPVIFCRRFLSNFPCLNCTGRSV